MKADLVNVVSEIYSNVNMKEYNVVNVGKDDGKGNQSAAAVMGAMMTQYNAIANAAKWLIWINKNWKELSKFKNLNMIDII